MTKRTHVLVVGGGYAGTMAANRLRLRTDIDITVVNPRPDFVQRIRLHQLAAGSGTAAVDYSELLGEGIRLVVDGADLIETADSTVLLTSGRDWIRSPRLRRRQHRRVDGAGRLPVRLLRRRT